MIKKEIRKSLIETKEKKERLLIEERLIKDENTEVSQLQFILKK